MRARRTRSGLHGRGPIAILRARSVPLAILPRAEALDTRGAELGAELAAMMYFSKLKTALIVGVCVLGVLLCLPNFCPHRLAWLPWRTVHLGLDLRGGSYLLLEVDMAAVIKERLDSLADAVRTGAQAAASTILPAAAGQPAQNRVLRPRSATPAQAQDAVAAAAAAAVAGARRDGRISTSLHRRTDDHARRFREAGLRERANAAVQQSIEIVRRRIDETGVVDPQITRQGDEPHRRPAAGHRGPEPDQGAARQDRPDDLPARRRERQPVGAARRRPASTSCRWRASRTRRSAVRRRVEVDGARPDRRPAGPGPADREWVVNFTFDSVGTRRFADVSTANVDHRFAIVLDDKVISAPVIREPITGGRGQISGNFTAGLGARPRRAAPRRRAARAADRGRGAHRRARAGRGQHPRRRDRARRSGSCS